MGSRSLLLVDDDPEMGVIVGLLCKRGGLGLSRFLSVEPAWESLAGGQRPDVVLLDVNLPGESGLELLRRVRGQRPNGLPVALFCQPGLRRDVAAGWAEGADYLFAKDLVADPPAWARRLGEILAHALDRDNRPSLEWVLDEATGPPHSWGKVVSRALEEPTLRSLGGAVLAQALRRCLIAGFGPSAAGCLHPVSGRVSAVALARPATPGQVRDVLSSLVDQVSCLLGNEAGRAVEQRLRAEWTS